MSTHHNRSYRRTRRLASVLRRMAFVSQQALANHTPAGPGSLATGQAAVRGVPGLACDECAQLARVAQSRPAFGPVTVPGQQAA